MFSAALGDKGSVHLAAFRKTLVLHHCQSPVVLPSASPLIRKIFSLVGLRSPRDEVANMDSTVLLNENK